MLCKSCIIQIPPGKHVSKSRVVQMPPGEHDLDGADRIGQG